ncbi:MAG: hypothetical protein ACLUDU_10790 [Butyricimonas faecihominis]
MARKVETAERFVWGRDRPRRRSHCWWVFSVRCTNRKEPMRNIA